MLVDVFIFIIFQLLVIYPLGKFILNLLEIKLWFVQNLIFSLIIGIFLLTLSVLTIGYTNNYNLLPLLIIFSAILFIHQLKNTSIKKFNLKFLNKLDVFVILVIVFCVFVQSIIVFPNGVTDQGNLRLKGVFTEDGAWHIAIINNLNKSVPPENPIFAGEKLSNYNYFADIFIATVQRFTGIDTLVLYFKLVGPYIALLGASSLYFILKALTNNKLISALGVLLVTLSSTYYYVFGIFKPDLNLTPSTFFGNDYVSRMVNYQLTFSYLSLTAFIFLLLSSKKRDSLKFVLISALLIASGIGFKSYGTILVIAALYLVGLYKALQKDLSFLKIAFSGTLFTGIIVFLFLRNNNATESIFSFDPFWIVGNIFTDPLRFNSPAWEAKRDFYIQSNNYLGISYLYIKGTAIFLLTNLGLKILGLLSIFRKSETNQKDVILLLAVIALIGIIMPLTFTQGGVKWNTVQFIYYSGFSLGILLVLLITTFQKKLRVRGVLILMFFVWISFLPGVVKHSNDYLSDKDNLTVYNFKGTQDSYRAAKFLSSQPDGILLLDSNYINTPFIIAISKKTAYFADPSIMSNLLVAWQERNKKVESYYNSSLNAERDNFLRINKINYIFTKKDTLREEKSLKVIYSNREISIYKTNQN
jgi:hypothetical protein